MTAASVGGDPIEGRQGHYAGAATRLVAFAADAGISWGLFTLGAAALAFTVQLVSGTKVSLTSHQAVSIAAAVVWEFIYFAYQWTLSGKTIGMALLGIQVVATDGSPIGARQAVLRTITLPTGTPCTTGWLPRPWSTPGMPVPPDSVGWPSRTPRPRPEPRSLVVRRVGTGATQGAVGRGVMEPAPWPD
jgi:uncharacterized RDD family membrane protein YckC